MCTCVCVCVRAHASVRQRERKGKWKRENDRQGGRGRERGREGGAGRKPEGGRESTHRVHLVEGLPPAVQAVGLDVFLHDRGHGLLPVVSVF